MVRYVKSFISRNENNIKSDARALAICSRFRITVPAVSDIIWRFHFARFRVLLVNLNEISKGLSSDCRIFFKLNSL